MNETGAKRGAKEIDMSLEVEVHKGQNEAEITLLATLAAIINSDQTDLKWDLLGLNVMDFHFLAHQDIFAAMKELAEAGAHVDQAAIHAKLGTSVFDESFYEYVMFYKLRSIFDSSLANAKAAMNLKKQLIEWRK